MGNQQKSCDLTVRDINMLTKTTGKNEDEIRRWHQDFCAESNNTGQMNKKQFKKYYSRLKQNPKLEQLTDHIFRAFDTSHSGSISFQEFLLAYIVTSGEGKSEKLDYAFDVYDIDGNQAIERKEVKTILGIIRNIHGLTEDDTKAYVETIMLTFDTNKDKVLTKKEFVDGFLSDSALMSMADPFNV